MSITSDFETIPSKDDWIRFTTPRTFLIPHKRQNERLLAIDDMLEDFAAQFLNPNQQGSSLPHLFLAALCCQWLIEKKDVTRSARKPAVQQLFRLALARVTALEPHAVFPIDGSVEDWDLEIIGRFLTMGFMTRSILPMQGIQRTEREWRQFKATLGDHPSKVANMRFIHLLKTHCIACCDLMISHPYTHLKADVDHFLANALLELLHIVPRMTRSLDLDNVGPGHYTAIKRDVERVDTLVALPGSGAGERDFSGYSPGGRRIMQALHDRLGAFKGGKVLRRQQWTETIPVPDPNPRGRPAPNPRPAHPMAHLYGNMGALSLGYQLERTDLFSVDENFRARAAAYLGAEGGTPRRFPSVAGTVRVAYLDDEERDTHYRLDFDGTHFRRVDNPYRVFHTGFPASPFLYAADTDGVIYLGRNQEQVRPGHQLRHSSFLAGHAVLCAGMIYIKNGKLQTIDNKSGHYQPSTDDLLRLLRILEMVYSQDLSSFYVTSYAWEAAQGPSVTAKEFFDARGDPARHTE